jgi:hypothetical protein
MKTANIIHEQKLTSYHKDGETIDLTPEEKLQFALYGLKDITSEVHVFCNTLQTVTFKTKKELDQKVKEVHAEFSQYGVKLVDIKVDIIS